MIAVVIFPVRLGAMLKPSNAAASLSADVSIASIRASFGASLANRRVKCAMSSSGP